LFRYRKHIGVNVGAWFVGERWISDELYDACPGAGPGQRSELASVSAHVKRYGFEATRLRWEQHWDTFMDAPKEILEMKAAGINAVRLPIGWFSLSRIELLRSTSFERYGAVYANCWSRILTFIQQCSDQGVGVLVDMHCLPGGANADAHSGTDSSEAGLYTDVNARRQALESIKFVIRELGTRSNVIGIEVANEPTWGQADFLKPFYLECLSYAKNLGHSIPLYIGDCWSPLEWATWAGQLSSDLFCVVDHHYYYCFDDKRKRRSPEQIIQGIQTSTELEKCSAAAHGQVVVGEFSLTLDESSLKMVSKDKRPYWTRAFGNAQLQQFLSHSAGAFFWTWKFQVRNGSNTWDLRDMIQNGSLPTPVAPQLDAPATICAAVQQRNKLKAVKTREHVAFWSTHGDPEQYEHWRYELGWDRGFADCLQFASEGEGLVCAFQERLVVLRQRAHNRKRGVSSFSWEYEHGYRAAWACFPYHFK
jgi:hypothetical protein